MSNITYQEEAWEAFEKDLQDITKLHKEEVGIYRDKLELNIMYDAYRKLYELGKVHVFTARDGEKLIGYYVSFLNNHMHYSDTLFSNNDVVFIHPDYRKGFVGIRLIKKVEEALKEKGVQVLVLEFKTWAPFDKLLKRLGWDYTARQYSKFIGD